MFQYNKKYKNACPKKFTQSEKKIEPEKITKKEKSKEKCQTITEKKKFKKSDKKKNQPQNVHHVWSIQTLLCTGR